MGNRNIARSWQAYLEQAAGCLAVAQRARKSGLAMIEVDNRNLIARIAQRHRGVKGERRFADSAFFIGKNDDVPVGAGA